MHICPIQVCFCDQFSYMYSYMYYVLYSMINSDPGPSNWDISWSLLNIWVILGALERGRCVLLYPVRVLTKSTWFQSYVGGPPPFFRVIAPKKPKISFFFEKLSNFLYTNGLCNHRKRETRVRIPVRTACGTVVVLSSVPIYHSSSLKYSTNSWRYLSLKVPGHYLSYYIIQSTYMRTYSKNTNW